MTGARGLDSPLASLEPRLAPGTYVFARVAETPTGMNPVVTVAEEEGLTVVVAKADAEAAGIPCAFEEAWITLNVHSALDVVGLIAAVATRLATRGISCNVVAGYHHDHLFVPFERAQEAPELLRTATGPDG